MDDDRIRAHFDGRARVEVVGRFSAPQQRRAVEIARELGYQFIAAEVRGGPFSMVVRLVYGRDDGPQAQRRRQLTITRLRNGGPLLPDIEPPPPPPPGPPPPAPTRPAQQPRRPSAAPPPPPPARTGPRIPPPPPYPPPPPSPAS